MTDDQSAAARFMEEHEIIKRELQAERDENRVLKQQNDELHNLSGMLREVNDRVRAYAAQETTRANMWLGHSMRLVGQLGAIEAIIGASKALAMEVARETAAKGLEADMPKEDVATMKVIAGTVGLPVNRLV